MSVHYMCANGANILKKKIAGDKDNKNFLLK